MYLLISYKKSIYKLIFVGVIVRFQKCFTKGYWMGNKIVAITLLDGYKRISMVTKEELYLCRSHKVHKN